MNKKGVINKVVGIAILLVFLAVVLFFIIGPEAILPQVAKAGEQIAEWVFGDLRKDKIEKTHLEIAKEVEETYNDILDVLRRPKEGGPCLLEHKPFPKDFKGYRITLSETEQGIYVQLIDENGRFLEYKTIGEKVPCVVGGTAAKKFYDNYLDGTPCTNCVNDYIVADIEFREDNKHIYVNGQEKESKDENLVFKTKEGNVCFFLTDDSWGGCDRIETAIDTDCLEKLANKEIKMNWCVKNEK